MDGAKKRKVETDADPTVGGIADLLECPVCLESPMLPPIRQCPNGHTICVTCSSQLPSCPSCRTKPLNIRCLALEQAAKSRNFPCRYAPHCSELIKYEEFGTHLTMCEFRPFACPALTPCEQDSFTLNEAAIRQHLQDKHAAMRRTMQACGVKSVETSIGFRLSQMCAKSVVKRSYKPDILEAFGGSFVLFVRGITQKIDDTWQWQFSMCVLCIGTRTAASKYHYQVSLRSGRKTLSYSSCPRPISDTAHAVLESNDCLTIREDSLRSYFTTERCENTVAFRVHVQIVDERT
eukprot:TRINITY_DN67095_c0_g1_i1.p1 TRINITY_DN67095_c0_g1~~TRINITY_DN67095_c0_g1_i1.p1  ORF type:complete len:310 (+),score=1.84 TRINITY_DN67095_c0_g1_i1:55-930(+)